MALDLAPALELRRREPGELFPRELSCGVNKATYERRDLFAPMALLKTVQAPIDEIAAPTPRR